MPRDPARFINRELSWLEFNQRVLEEATDQNSPLLERLKFLAITASNLDEFFMVRVGGLQLVREAGGGKRDIAGMTPAEQLAAIAERAHQMSDEQDACLLDDIEPALGQAGIRRVKAGELSQRQTDVARKLFEQEILPVYSPMAVDDDTFPMLVNCRMNILVRLQPAEGTDESRYAIIPIGGSPHRFVSLPSERGYAYILLEDVIATFIEQYFPGEIVVETIAFRATRNADMAVSEDMAADLIAGMEEVLAARKESDCVRLEIADGVSKPSLGFLKKHLAVDDRDIYKVRAPLDLSAFMKLSGISGYDDLRFEPWLPQQSPRIDLTQSMFEIVRQGDVMLALPYESFEPVVRMLDEAADDEHVLAIKIILYRTSRNSPIVAALHRAAEKGKNVTAVVELKARFDEARNIEWARRLEQAGVQVIYGVKGLKTHAKVCLIIRRESHGIQRYTHFSTGNYNEATARLYSDTSYLTCDDELAADAACFFNAITGYSQPQAYKKIAAAPLSLRDRLLELIEGEIDRKRQHQDAKIMAQVNSLADPIVIEKLYEASQAGVSIDLNVRGICCLRPDMEGLSENIRVTSILDRNLEHSRIIYFRHGGDELVFISSADWMPRNLIKRVELLVPIEDPPSKKRLVKALQSYTNDNVKGRRLRIDGTYKRRKPGKRHAAHQHQLHQFELACQARKKQEQSQRTVFEPHRAAGIDA